MDNKQIIIDELFFSNEKDIELLATDLLAKLSPLDKGAVWEIMENAFTDSSGAVLKHVNKILQLVGKGKYTIQGGKEIMEKRKRTEHTVDIKSQQQSLDKDNIDIVIEELRDWLLENEYTTTSDKMLKVMFDSFATSLLKKLSPLNRKTNEQIDTDIYNIIESTERKDFEAYGEITDYVKSLIEYELKHGEVVEFSDKQDKVIAEGEVENMLCYECNEGYMVGGKTTDEIFRDYCGSEIKLSIKKTKGILD